MPLKRLRDEYLEQDGVRFLMENEAGSTVACRVSHEALRDHADRLHLPGPDADVFAAYRELIEQIASDPTTPRARSMIMAGYSSPRRRWHGSCGALEPGCALRSGPSGSHKTDRSDT
jgi:hypothetical protein